ncbi:MAG: DMT family transporter [Anaerolineales bacterium]|nr:MAG: DMT family transporter [Anaerolineales bacterium]
MKTRGLLYVALIATTLVWGGSFVAIKQALRYLSPLELILMRFVPASLAFALLILWRERTVPARLLREQWRSLCLMGLFGVAAYHLALNTGERMIPAGTASLIVALNPAFIVVLSTLFLRERVTWIQILGLSMAFLGLFIVVRYASGGELDLTYLRGVLITLIAPLSWAVYTVVSRPVAMRYSPLAVTGMGTATGTAVMLFAARPSLLDTAMGMPWDGWASVAFLALVCTVGGVTVWVTALQQLEAASVGVFIYLVPLWAAVLSKLVLGEGLTVALMVGALIVVGGVALANGGGRTVKVTGTLQLPSGGPGRA